MWMPTRALSSEMPSAGGSWFPIVSMASTISMAANSASWLADSVASGYPK